jgi:hypothetical protein
VGGKKKSLLFFFLEMVAESAERREAESGASVLDRNVRKIVDHYKDTLNDQPDSIVDVQFSTDEDDGTTLRARVSFYSGTNAEEHIKQLLQNHEECRNHNVEIYNTFDRSKYVFCVVYVPTFGVAIMLVKRPGT